MEDGIGAALVRFERALKDLRRALGTDAHVADLVFGGTDVWTDLLSYKLIPHLAGDGCLIVGVAGGTNTGKSTVFNLLLGRPASAVAATAAATSRPLLAANSVRAQQCLDGMLVPEFQPLRLENAEDVLNRHAPADALYIAEAESLPDRLVLLDTPDVDSIEQTNWEIADHLRALGDVIVAVVTAEKYRDERVVGFFQHARRSGRVILPLMNKADPRDGYAVARRQLSEFCADVGIDGPCFVAPHDFDLGTGSMTPIAALDNGGPDLLRHLLEIDVRRIKEEVFRGSLEAFAQQVEGFLARADEMRAELRATANEFRDRARQAAQGFEPVPGAEVGGLFHEFVQERRDPIRRWVGATSKTVARGATVVGRTVFRAVRKRTRLEADSQPDTDEKIRVLQEEDVAGIARVLATSYFDTRPNLREPAAHLVEAGLDGLDTDAAIAGVVRDTLQGERISEAFRQHAHRMLEIWWKDHKGRRRAVEALDVVLTLAPAVIAVGLAVPGTAVPGAPDAVLYSFGATYPLAEQFAARVFEYQFGDAIFDFLSPWREEQRAALADALERHVTGPALARLDAVCAPLEGETIAELRAALAELTPAASESCVLTP